MTPCFPQAGSFQCGGAGKSRKCAVRPPTNSSHVSGARGVPTSLAPRLSSPPLHISGLQFDRQARAIETGACAVWQRFSSQLFFQNRVCCLQPPPPTASSKSTISPTCVIRERHAGLIAQARPDCDSAQLCTDSCSVFRCRLRREARAPAQNWPPSRLVAVERTVRRYGTSLNLRMTSL